jgi:N-acetyl-alpha-D-glucosaminyl L-malate synthase BshA
LRIGISCYPTLGGSGALATELGKALAVRGHEVHFIVSGLPFRLGPEADAENLYIHEVETATYPVLRSEPHDLALAAKMADVIRHHDLDILHVHYAVPFAVCAFLARVMLGEHRVRVVTTLHGTDITILAQDPLLRDAIRLGIEQSHVVTAVSQHLIDQTEEWFHPRCPIVKVYNFVDTNVFRRAPSPAWRRRLAQGGEKVLAHISNFRAVKRIPDVLDIFCRVRERIPAKLMLVGEGPDLDRARRIVQTCGLERDVAFLGKREDVASLLSAADLFLLPSEQESFGLAALEAMACGVPVVASRAGGLPEVVQDGRNGYLLPIGDTQAMAMRALELLAERDRWEAFSRAARERSEEFSAPAQVSRYEELYERTMAGAECV